MIFSRSDEKWTPTALTISDNQHFAIAWGLLSE